MSQQLYNYFKNIENKLNSISLIQSKKNKKNTFYLKDGIFKLFVKFNKNNIDCQMCKNPKLCSLKKCHHIYYVLIHIYKLDLKQISLIWKDDNWEKFINQEIIDFNNKWNEEECGICLDEIITKKFNYYDIYQCLECGNLMHNKCLRKTEENHCLFCYSSNKSDLF